MIKLTNVVKTKWTLEAGFDAASLNKEVAKKANRITEFASKKQAIIYVGKKDKLTREGLKATAKAILTSGRDFQLDIKSLTKGKLTSTDVIEVFTEMDQRVNGVLWSAKTSKKAKANTISLTGASAADKKTFKAIKAIEEARTYARDLQIMPPNVLNSETMAAKIKKDFAEHKNLSVKVLNKKQITDLKMGLLLSVNLGSAYEPRVVIIEYKGNPSSKEKTVVVGKGITFDAGGYNIKTGRYMSDMKFDMSGAAIATGAMKALSSIAPKKNFSAVLVLTDNMINSVASTPDAVFTAMNGKTVEINNTDAEGRLALADGLTYAAKKLKATRLIDIATLTGAVLSALGHTYTGVWATTDKAWKDLESASKRAHELTWRLPLHDDYFKYMKGSKVADMKNTDLTGMGGSSTAAMFLKNFTEGKEYIHLDVAGTADVNGTPMGAMLRTLVEVA